MKYLYCFFLLSGLLSGCDTKITVENSGDSQLPLTGTWQLISGTTIIKNDTLLADYTLNQKMIKIINNSHFAFLRHDLNGGKDSLAVYSAGGGKYSLSGNNYTEYLEFFNDRRWEGNEFHFTIDIVKDTLIQTGVEKLDSLGIDQKIIERYVRVK